MGRPLAQHARAAATPLVALLIALAGLCAITPHAQAAFAEGDNVEIIKLDSARSQVDFRIRLIWLLRIGGRFGAVNGNVRVDRFRSEVSVEAHIDVNAIRMDSTSSEEWAKSAEFFDAQDYPLIDFSSEPFPRARLHEGGDLSGTLTLRGIRQTVHFELLPSTCDHPAYDCPIEVEGSIRRSVFGMHSRHGTLSDRVELRLSVYAATPTSP